VGSSSEEEEEGWEEVGVVETTRLGDGKEKERRRRRNEEGYSVSLVAGSSCVLERKGRERERKERRERDSPIRQKTSDVHRSHNEDDVEPGVLQFPESPKVSERERQTKKNGEGEKRRS